MFEEYGASTKIELFEYPLVVAEPVMNKISPILLGNAVAISSYIDESKRYGSYYNPELKKLADGIQSPTQEEKIQVPTKIYLIIGESATRDNMSLYGYPIPTTPFADSLALEDSRFSFYKGMCSATLTRDAIRQVVSESSPHDMGAFLSSKTLIDMANDQNYHTVWTAPGMGLMKFRGATYLQLLAMASDTIEGVTGNEDFELVDFARKITEPEKKQFILINLSGSHTSYSEGYDHVDELSLPLDSDLTLMENEYNRTLHHTDRVLEDMYRLMLQDSSSLMIYLSDHGENIGKGHGMKEGTAQTRIPFMIVNNSPVNIDEIVSKYIIEYNGEPILNSLSTFYILAEAMGYNISDIAVEYAKEESQYIYHVDKVVQPFSKMKELQ